MARTDGAGAAGAADDAPADDKYIVIFNKKGETYSIPESQYDVDGLYRCDADRTPPMSYKAAGFEIQGYEDGTPFARAERNELAKMMTAATKEAEAERERLRGIPEGQAEGVRPPAGVPAG
jgi:hypothetical protein